MHHASPYNRRLGSIFLLVLTSVIIITQFPAAFGGAPTCASPGPNVDCDGDSFTPNEGDCDDFDANIHPPGQVCDPFITAIYKVMDDVEDLAEAGTINQGQATALLAKLNSAVAKIEADKINTAISLLNAFINQINALMKSQVITIPVGQELIDGVLSIIKDLKMI